MEPHDDTRQDLAEVISSPSTYVTLEEAILLFEDAGIFRSIRTLSRYCQQGILDCTKEEMLSGAMRYMVTKESVSNRILEMQQLGTSRNVQSRPDMASHDTTQPDMTRHDETEVKALEERVEELEREKAQLSEENIDLKIDVGTKKAVLKQTLENYNQFMSERDMLLKHIGSLETQVKQIAPPRNEPTTIPVESAHSQNWEEADSREYSHNPVPSPTGNGQDEVYNS